MAVHVPGTRALRALDAAARHLNFSRAADELGLTPAAVSHQIKEIEDKLGVALFSRTSRTVQLTSAGAIVHEAAVEALGVLDRATTKARKMQRGDTQLRVSLYPMFAAKWLVPRVDRFRKLRPDIDLRFDISSQIRDFDR